MANTVHSKEYGARQGKSEGEVYKHLLDSWVINDPDLINHHAIKLFYANGLKGVRCEKAFVAAYIAEIKTSPMYKL